MSGNSIIPLLRDYDVKEVKTHTFKLKHDDNTEKKLLMLKNLMEQQLKFYLTLCCPFKLCHPG